MSTLIKYSEEDDEIKELTNSVEIYSDALDVMINEAKTYTKCAEAGINNKDIKKLDDCNFEHYKFALDVLSAYGK